MPIEVRCSIHDAKRETTDDSKALETVFTTFIVHRLYLFHCILNFKPTELVGGISSLLNSLLDFKPSELVGYLLSKHVFHI